MNRFPDLEERVVAMSDLDVGFLAARRGVDDAAWNGGYYGGGDIKYGEERGYEGDWDLRRLRRGARLKGRVAGWVRRAKEVVLGGEVKSKFKSKSGSGLKSRFKLKSKFNSKSGFRSRPSRWDRRR